MAVFSIKCPHCGTDLEVQDEWVNMETTCPICNNPFIIPSRPLVNPVPVKPELKLPPQTGPVVAEIVEDGPQAPPYSGPSEVHSSWDGQTAAPSVNPFLRPFVNCLTTKGRASRLEYNLFIFISFPVLCFVFFLVVFLPISSFYAGVSDLHILIAILYYIYWVFWTLPISVRRFHDFGYIGMHYLFLFIPIIQIIYFLYLVFRPSDPEENAFGPRP